MYVICIVTEKLYTVSRKRGPKMVFGNIFYKSQAILTKFGTWCLNKFAMRQENVFQERRYITL